MTRDIGYLHHVGHVVGDMVDALDLYRRLGFVVDPPSYPAMARTEGGVPEAFGAANTHAELGRGFIELATPVREGSRIPAEAELVPLQAPAEVLPRLMQRIGETSDNLGACLDRFEGLHILMLQSPDIESAAARLTDHGIVHGGVNTVQRPVDTPEGTKLETVSYLEIGESGTVPEGRVGVAATRAGVAADHPNGAIDLAGVVLCVPDDDLDTVCQRYATYLDRTASEGPVRFVLDDGAEVVIVAASGLTELLPGVAQPPLPAFVACTVVVRDLSATRSYLESGGFTLGATSAGRPFVTVLGASLIFRD